MKGQSIEVVVQASGELAIEAYGFKGADCEKATAFLEQALGVIANKRRKPEFHRSVLRKTTQRLGHENG
jgi:hypothetical protein